MFGWEPPRSGLVQLEKKQNSVQVLEINFFRVCRNGLVIL